jgi:hypothetical protein
MVCCSLWFGMELHGLLYSWFGDDYGMFFVMVFYGLVRFGIVWYGLNGLWYRTLHILNDVTDLVYCFGPCP